MKGWLTTNFLNSGIDLGNTRPRQTKNKRTIMNKRTYEVYLCDLFNVCYIHAGAQ